MPGLSRDEKRREVQRAAYRHYGRKYAFWIVAGPWIVKGLAWVTVLALAYVTWSKVPHVLLGTIALTLAGGGAAALAWPNLKALGNSRARMIRNAIGESRPRMQLGWAYATLLIAGSGMGYLALWSPFS